MGERDPHELYSAQSAIVLGRRVNSAELLAIAQDQRAFDPTIFEQHPPFFVPVEISSNRIDAYYTRMHRSTLENFAREAATGVAVQDSHLYRELGFGQSLTGRLVAEADVTRVESEYFTIPGLTTRAGNRTDDYILGIKAGLYRDISVGFYLGADGRFVCSICGGDPTEWFGDCRHWPGKTYDVTNEDGDVVGEEVAVAWIHNAHLVEYSQVYDGATPGAGVKRAQQGIAAGEISLEQAQALERLYRVRLPGAYQVWAAGAGRGKERGMTELETTIRHDAGTERASTSGAETTVTMEVTGTEAAPAELDELTAFAADMLALRETLAKEPYQIALGDDPVAAIRVLADEIVRLRGLAEDGRTYRKDLIEEAMVEGRRAMPPAQGHHFDEAGWRAFFARDGISLLDIKRQRDQWRLQGDAFHPGGRRSREVSEELGEVVRRGAQDLAHMG